MAGFYPYGQPNYSGINYPAYQPNYQQPMQPTQSQMQAQQPVQQTPQTQPTTNKIYVTSLEDALARFASPNSITVYHLQDESGEIEIATDGFGKKNYKIYKRAEFQPTEANSGKQPQYLTAEYANGLEQQLQGLESRLKLLEAKFNKQTKVKQSEGVDNE